MIGRGQGGGAVHPFMVGLAMETLIHWYELNLAEGHPDYRVIPVIKEGLDGLWTYNWLPKQHMFDYNRYRLPPNLGTDYAALNNLVSVAYAWYWLQTGDTQQRDRGDQLFEHAFDNPAASSWSGKQFSQQFEFSFDYVRFRKGIDGSTVLPANNPYTGPYADTVPPISEKVNCDPNYGYLKGCKAGTIGSTTATDFLDHLQAVDDAAGLRQVDQLRASLTSRQEYGAGSRRQSDRLAARNDLSLPH